MDTGPANCRRAEIPPCYPPSLAYLGTEASLSYPIVTLPSIYIRFIFVLRTVLDFRRFGKNQLKWLRNGICRALGQSKLILEVGFTKQTCCDGSFSFWGSFWILSGLGKISWNDWEMGSAGPWVKLSWFWSTVSHNQLFSPVHFRFEDRSGF